MIGDENRPPYFRSFLTKELSFFFPKDGLELEGKVRDRLVVCFSVMLNE